MNKVHLVVVTIIVFLTISCNKKKDHSKEKPPVVVDIIVAWQEIILSTIEVNGSALSEEMIDLQPEISGRLVFLNLPDGGNVKAGTILARINDNELQAQLEQQKVQLALAKKTEQRLNTLLAINGVTQAEYDAAFGQMNTLSASIKILNAQIDKTIIKAPFNGILGLRLVSLGAYITPQTILGTLQQTDKIKIDFSVPESYSSVLKIGNTIQVQSNGNDVKQTAIINSIDPQIRIDNRSIKVRARLQSGSLQPGEFVKVIINSDRKGIMVPSNSIIPDASSNKVVVIKKKKACFVNVETGVRNADAIELLSGVESGDSIVVSGVLFVRPNANVKIRSVKKQAK